MSHNGLEPQPTIPGVMVSLEDGAVIDDHDGEPATLHALGVYVTTPEDTNLMAGLQQPGPDARRPADQARRRRARRRRRQLLPAAPAASRCRPRLLELPRRHLDGDAAPRRRGRRRPRRPPGWTAAAGSLGDRQHRPAGRAPASRDGRRDRRRRRSSGAGLLDVAAAVDAVAGARPGQQVVRLALERIGRQSFVLRSSSRTSASVSRTFTVSVSDVANDGVTFATNGGTVHPGRRAHRRRSACPLTSTKGAADGHKQATLRVTSRRHRGRARDALRPRR